MKKNNWMTHCLVLAMTVVVLGLAACAPTAEVEPEPPEVADTEEAGEEVPTAQMKNGLGEEVTLIMRFLPESRGYIYCELVFNYGEDVGFDIYSTSHIAPCDVDWWNNLDLEAVAAERGAISVIKNGPQWWSMDEVDQMEGDPVSVAGVPMGFGAHLPPGTLGTPDYEVFLPAKQAALSLTGGLTFDFKGDGTEKPAKLLLVMDREALEPTPQ